MKKILLLPILLLLAYSPAVHAQSLDIPVEGYGISFGNSKNFTGLRFNLVDKDVEQINGLNLTFGLGFSGEFNGISLWLVGAAAKELNGLHVAGIGLGSEDINGLAASFGLIFGKTLKGISVGGVTKTDEAYGISLNWFGHRFKKAKGLFISFLGGIIEEELTGISIGFFSSPHLRSDPSYETDAPRKLSGMVLSMDPHAIKLNGFMLGLGVEGNEINGLALGALWVKPLSSTLNINGIAIGGLATVTDRMNGISIGLVNYAKELNGIQIGLVNIAKNNPPWAQILPGINAHFSF